MLGTDRNNPHNAIKEKYKRVNVMVVVLPSTFIQCLLINNPQLLVLVTFSFKAIFMRYILNTARAVYFQYIRYILKI